MPTMSPVEVGMARAADMFHQLTAFLPDEIRQIPQEIIIFVVFITILVNTALFLTNVKVESVRRTQHDVGGGGCDAMGGQLRIAIVPCGVARALQPILSANSTDNFPTQIIRI